MGVAYLIIGLVALWILWSIAKNKMVQAKNQVRISKLLKELINEVSGKQKYKLLIIHLVVWRSVPFQWHTTTCVKLRCVVQRNNEF